MFALSVSPSKWVAEPALEVGRLAASPIAKTLSAALLCSVWMSTGTKPSSSPRPGERATNEAPPCSGMVTSRSKGISRSSQLTSLPGLAVDATGRELGLQGDLLLGEHAAEVRGGDRLGEGGVERRRVGDLDLRAHAALAQEPVGEEAELERRDRALDRHVDQVHDQPPALEARPARRAAPPRPRPSRSRRRSRPSRGRAGPRSPRRGARRRWRSPARRREATTRRRRWTVLVAVSTRSTSARRNSIPGVQLRPARADDALRLARGRTARTAGLAGRRGGRRGRRRRSRPRRRRACPAGSR